MSAPYDVHPADEPRHTPDAEDLWNESYYCDFVQADGSLGGWLRLGLYPNRGVAWWTAWIVRPGASSVASVDYRAPVPPGDSLVGTTTHDDTRIEIDLRRPLEEFRLAADTAGLLVDGDTRSYDETGRTPTRLGVDLTWTTDGEPYHYVATTRYEIPCTVRGSVTVDGETIAVEGQGQRDHSWGVRDWWAFGWCWCSLRLDDATRVHLADIRMFPGVPLFFGYVQGTGLVERNGYCDGHRSDALGVRTGPAAGRRGGSDQPISPGHDRVPYRRRTERCRLDRVEPTPMSGPALERIGRQCVPGGASR